MSIKSDVKEIFDHWNQEKIIVHKVLDRSMTNVISSLLNDPDYPYAKEDLMEAITLYAQVLKSSDHWFTYKWRIEEFFKRSPGFRQFLPESEPLTRFLRDGDYFGSGSTTPPVLSVSSSFKENFLAKKKKGENTND